MFRGLEFGVGSLERGSRSGARQCLDLELRSVEAEVFGGSGNRKLFQVVGVWVLRGGSLGVWSCKIFVFVVGCWELRVGSWEFWELSNVLCLTTCLLELLHSLPQLLFCRLDQLYKVTHPPSGQLFDEV